MVKKGKELRNVKDESASCHILDPSHANEMGQSNTHICCGFEFKTAKLTMVYEIVNNHMKLDSVTDDFFDKFSQCVQEDNGSE